MVCASTWGFFLIRRVKKRPFRILLILVALRPFRNKKHGIFITPVVYLLPKSVKAITIKRAQPKQRADEGFSPR